MSPPRTRSTVRRPAKSRAVATRATARAKQVARKPAPARASGAGVQVIRRLLELPKGYRSTAAGLFVAQMNDQSRRLTEDTRGLTPEELEWQSAPGMNTIGMLLAHIAIVEVFWVQLGPLGRDAFDVKPVLGIGDDDDGMPIPAGGGPPQSLHGRDLAFYDDLLARAREHTGRAVQPLTDRDLEHRIERPGKDGIQRIISLQWILYHILEHQAGHYGQINLLRHQRRAVDGET